MNEDNDTAQIRVVHPEVHKIESTCPCGATLTVETESSYQLKCVLDSFLGKHQICPGLVRTVAPLPATTPPIYSPPVEPFGPVPATFQEPVSR